MRIAVALLTFSLGTFVTSLFTLKHKRPEEVFFQPPTANRVVTKVPFAGPWKRIHVGRVSFSIPAKLKKTGLPGTVGVVEAFRGPFVDQEFLYVNYSYGKSVSSDYNVPPGELTDLLINGKPAKLYITKFDERMKTSRKDRPGMELVVPDVGAGRTKFEIYAVGFDLELIRQIIDSVEIRSSRPLATRRLKQTRR